MIGPVGVAAGQDEWVGAPDFAPSAGVAYVLKLGAGGWEVDAKLTPVGAALGDRFGEDVAISLTEVAVGAPRESALLNDAGAVYTYANVQGAWTFKSFLRSPNIQADSWFGSALDIGGDTRSFQGWYRDPIGGPCAGGFNFTPAIEVTFTD